MAKTFEAMQKQAASSSLSRWQFLDLKNRRQAGDLHKKILYLNQKNNCQVFNFCSSRRQEGVSTVFANFISYLDSNKSDKKNLIIDVNFQAPLLHTIFKLKIDLGVTDILKGSSTLAESVQELGSTGIKALSCGSQCKKISCSVEQEKFDALISEAKKEFDFIFIDSGSIFSATDAISAAIASDITFLVIQSLKVQIEVAQKVKSLLHDNECAIGGVILNRVQQVIPNWMYRII